MKHIVVVAVVLGLAVLAVPIPTGAQQLVVSNTTWTVTAISSNGLPKALGNAEAVCLNAGSPTNCPSGAVLYGSPDAWFANLSSIPGAIWIWAPGVRGTTPQADLQTFWFTRNFLVRAKPVTATLSIGADNYTEIMINGQLVGAHGSVTNAQAGLNSHNVLRKFSVQNFLHTGVNQMVIRAQNGPSSFVGTCNPCTYAENPAGVVLGLNIKY